MFGFFNIRKPPGPTSHDVVARVRRLVPPGTRVGHAGTLDPFAEGVLVVCVGQATRLADHVQAWPKRYVAHITFGATSATDDPEGPITPDPQAAPVSERELRQALRAFVGTIRQVPPAHSAVHVEGRRAYRLARAGRSVDLPPRVVTIHAIDLLRYDWPIAEIDVRCGSGTYLRALSRDIGADLNVGGYCSGLVRTEVGPFRIEQAVEPDQLDPAVHLLPPLTAVADLPRVTVGPADARRILNGRAVQAPALPAAREAAVISETGDLLALAKVQEGGTLQPVRVFPPAASR